MLKTRLFPSLSALLRISLSLIAVLLAACAPVSTPANPMTAATEPQVEPSPTFPAATLESATQPAVEPPTQASAPTVLPAATSRGPDLHATDPATVSLASGGLQFVEFFRFT